MSHQGSQSSEQTHLRLISDLPKADLQFYTDITLKIQADLNFYQGSGDDGGAELRYNDAEHDYNNQRKLTTIKKSNGKQVPLFLVNAEKQVIKRYSGLIAGADDSLFVIPSEVEDEQFSDIVDLYLRDYTQSSDFKFKKRKLANHFKRIGNAYFTTYYDPLFVNQRYDTVGTIVQELIPFYEVLLDANSRNSYDPASPYFRNRETRYKRMPHEDVRKLAKAMKMDPKLIEEIGQFQVAQSSPNSFDNQEQNKEIPEDERAIIFEHEYRELVRDVDGGGKPTGAIVYQHLNCKIINNNPRLILQEIKFNDINKFMIEVACIDDRDDTPYGAGLMEDTREHRELQRELVTAEIENARSGRLATLIETRSTQAELDARFGNRLNDSTAVLKINKGDIIHDPPVKTIPPFYEQLYGRIEEGKQDIGGEHNLQAGKQSFASETGKLANILNSRADLSKSEDIAVLERVLSNSLNTFFLLSRKFYDLNIIIPKLVDDGTNQVSEFIELNLAQELKEENKFDIRIKIDLNSESVKAANQLLVQANVDIISRVDRLELSGAQQPKLLHKRWLEEQGLNEIAEFIAQSPEHAQTINLAMQGILQDEEQSQIVEEQLKNSLN